MFKLNVKRGGAHTLVEVWSDSCTYALQNWVASDTHLVWNNFMRKIALID